MTHAATTRHTNINVLHRRLAAVFAELFEHPHCSAKVREVLGEAQCEILNHTGVQNDASSARYFLADAMAELIVQEECITFPHEIGVS